MTHANHQDTRQPCQDPRLAKNWACTPTSTKKTHIQPKILNRSERYFHIMLQSHWNTYILTKLYIYNIFSAEFHTKSNIFEIKYEVPPKIVPRLIHSTSTSWEQSKHPTDSSGKSPRRQDWEWRVRSDQLCAAGGVICTHRKLFGCLFLCHFPKS